MSEPTERDRLMAAECMPALLPGGISMPSREALAEHFAQARAEGAREEREAILAIIDSEYGGFDVAQSIRAEIEARRKETP